jgi:uncharacterized Fe-S radical SAM superfamily protein PflX
MMAGWTSTTEMKIKLEQAVESVVRKIKAGDLPPNSHNLEADVRGTIVASEVKECHRCGEDLQTNRQNPDGLCDLCADDDMN